MIYRTIARLVRGVGIILFWFYGMTGLGEMAVRCTVRIVAVLTVADGREAR